MVVTDRDTHKLMHKNGIPTQGLMIESELALELM